MLSLLLVALLTAGVAEASSNITIQKLGTYDYMVFESSPIMYNGKLLMMESICANSPLWAGYWDPAFANCSGYFRVRDLYSGVVIVNITESCNIAFGNAIVVPGDSGDTLYIFGTAWERCAIPRGHVPITSACETAEKCTVSSVVTSDPSLQSWSLAIAAYPNSTVYNTDVTRVQPSFGEAAIQSRKASGLPPHQFIMMLETSGAQFAISNSSDPSDSSAWIFLNRSEYSVNSATACPSIRFDASTGYYYALSGGYSIGIWRSLDLRKWETGVKDVLVPTNQDCIVADQMWARYHPSAPAQQLINSCLNNTKNTGWGDDNDVDLTQMVFPNGTVATLFQYGASNQRTFGFSDLAIAQAPMFATLASFFP